MAVHITKQRAAVSDDFKKYLRLVSEAFIREIKEQIDRNPRSKDYILGREKVRLARHVALLKDPAAMDMEVTRLRNLPYTRFEVLEVPAYDRVRYEPYAVPETVYLSGTTTDIICSAGRDGKYDMGPYRVSFSIGVFGLEGLKREHFIPLRSPYGFDRFWHHNGHETRDSEYEGDPSYLPEHMRPSTCWGSFGTAISGVLGDRNVSGLFRTAYDYLTRANLHSRLAYPGREWCKEIA